jgi:hypothetical protein
MSSDQLREMSPHTFREYEAALPALIAEAQSTISARVDQLNMDHGGTPEERTYLATALAGLHTLKRERLGERDNR